MTKPSYLTHNKKCVVEDAACPETLGDLLKWVQHQIDAYGATSEVCLETPRWEDEDHAISVYQWTPKTEKELNDLARAEQNRRIAQEANERVVYERLKKKYE